MSELRKQLTNKQFDGVTETQKTLAEARQSLALAQQRTQEAERAAVLVLEVVCDAHGVTTAQIANLDSTTKELIIAVQDEPAAPPVE